MENENVIYRETTYNAARRLAVIDFVIAVLPTPLFLILIASLFQFVGQASELRGVLLILLGPVFLINSIFGIISYRDLTKMKIGGITMSIIPKVISIIALSIYMIIPIMACICVYALPLLAVNIFFFILIRYALSIKKEMISDIGDIER